MFKLNNRGWGFGTFLVFLAVFSLAILLIVIGCIQLGISSNSSNLTVPVGTSNSPSSFNLSEVDLHSEYLFQAQNYEKQLEEVGIHYIQLYYPNLVDGDSLIFSLVDFVNANYMNRLELKGNICTGYFTIDVDQGKNNYHSYINCDGIYTTEHYQDSFDKSFE